MFFCLVKRCDRVLISSPIWIVSCKQKRRRDCRQSAKKRNDDRRQSSWRSGGKRETESRWRKNWRRRGRRKRNGCGGKSQPLNRSVSVLLRFAPLQPFVLPTELFVSNRHLECVSAAFLFFSFFLSLSPPALSLVLKILAFVRFHCRSLVLLRSYPPLPPTSLHVICPHSL